ncbi:hypothetical protein DL95DRAFT_453964 [Leptodontidium sp. 2 PMI_412]|nr:hypothetical protein DL95DRAFT_453964 [Leptodontidium sp. 2 PMI_412]
MACSRLAIVVLRNAFSPSLFCAAAKQKRICYPRRLEIVEYSYCPTAKSRPSIVATIVRTEVEYCESSSATIEWSTKVPESGRPRSVRIDDILFCGLTDDDFVARFDRWAPGVAGGRTGIVMIEARTVSQEDELGEKAAEIDARSFDLMRKADDLAQGESRCGDDEVEVDVDNRDEG